MEQSKIPEVNGVLRLFLIAMKKTGDSEDPTWLPVIKDG